MSTHPHILAHARAFSLVEAAISTIIVATMFAAALAATGAAARDRQTQTDMRTGQALARMLMTEISQQRYASATPNTIAPTPGISTTSRSDWAHIDDYSGFKESPPTYRYGTRIEAASGWTWEATIAYQSVTPFSGAGVTGGLTGSGAAVVVGGLIGGITGAIGAVLGTDSAAPSDTGLKRIVVTVTSPTGKATKLTGLRSANGAVDRVSQTPGFRSWACVGVTISENQQPAQTGVPLLNTPGLP